MFRFSLNYLPNAIGFVVLLVPGATPKNPNSGLIARKRPSSSKCIQAISSPARKKTSRCFYKIIFHLPIHSTLYPGIPIGRSMAKFVFPQALKHNHKIAQILFFRLLTLEMQQQNIS
jgi:hypothetical protein